MIYEEQFKDYPVETKRRDLMGNPLFDAGKIKEATDEAISELHKTYFKAMNKAVEEVTGESLY